MGGRAFGWRQDGQVIPDEADVVRRMAAAVLSGKPTKVLAAELTREGITTATGGPWAASSIARALQRPRMAGYRLDEAGGLVDDPEVEAILDPATWNAVRVVFADPVRKKFISSGRESLSLRFLTCGKCGAPMHGQGTRARCSGCMRVGIMVALVDKAITERVLARITSQAWLDLLRQAVADHGARHVEAKAAAAERMRVLAEAFGAGEIERAALVAGLSAARAVIDAADEALLTAREVGDLASMDDAEIVRWWTEDLDVAGRRDVAGVVLGSVEVLPRTVGVFGEDRLVWHWK